MQDNDNIYFNEESLNSGLNKYGNKNPFRTDSGYFENFQEKMMELIELSEELKEIAPILNSIPKYNHFSVPAEYFEDLPLAVQRTVTGNPGRSVNSVSDWLKMIFRPNFALPVLCVILIAFAGIHYMNRTQGQKPEIAVQISVEDQLQNIDESTLIDALASAEEDFPNAENDNIKEYLIDNDIDESNLNYEL